MVQVWLPIICTGGNIGVQEIGGFKLPVPSNWYGPQTAGQQIWMRSLFGFTRLIVNLNWLLGRSCTEPVANAMSLRAFGSTEVEVTVPTANGRTQFVADTTSVNPCVAPLARLPMANGPGAAHLPPLFTR